MPALLTRRWFWAAAAIPVLLVAISWYFTEPLSRSRPEPTPPSPAAVPAEAVGALEALVPTPLAWPAERIEGDEAKRLLYDLLVEARSRLDQSPGYTATFRKQERIRGRLNPEQTLFMKVRKEPFSVYLKFLAPVNGKEVVYSEGSFDNHMIAHEVGPARLLVPRLKVSPTSALALADNRHPITRAGLYNLMSSLVGFRLKDLTDDDATTVMDWATDGEGRLRPRSIHGHSIRTEERPFARVIVLYDPDTLLPYEFLGYDWPEGPDAALQLGERYVYDNVELDAGLADIDFDPANTDYAFTRF